jgi:hypothetical protein
VDVHYAICVMSSLMVHCFKPCVIKILLSLICAWLELVLWMFIM